MATRLLQIANKKADNPTYPKGKSFDYPVDSSLTQAQAEAKLASDQAFAAKLESPRRAPGANLYWKLIANATPSRPTRFLGRNAAGPNVPASVSLYWEQPAGLTGYRTRLVAVGQTAALPDVAHGLTDELRYDAAGYTRTNLIDDTLRCHYASLHLNVPNGTYRIEFLNASGTVVYASEQTLTGDGPNMPLPAAAGDGSGNQAPVISKPVSNVSATLNDAFSYQLAADLFTDPDGQIVSMAVSTLPQGLTYTGATRTIAGTPTLAGTYVITITGTDNLGASVATQFVITVGSVSTQNPGWVPGVADAPLGVGRDDEGTDVEESQIPVNP